MYLDDSTQEIEQRKAMIGNIEYDKSKNPTDQLFQNMCEQEKIKLID